MINERTIRIISKKVEDGDLKAAKNHRDINYRIEDVENQHNLAVEQGAENINKLLKVTKTMQQDIDTMKEVVEGHGAEIAALKSKLAAALDGDAGDTPQRIQILQPGQIDDYDKNLRGEIEALQRRNEKIQAEVAVMREKMNALLQDAGRKRSRSDEDDEAGGGPQKKSKKAGEELDEAGDMEGSRGPGAETGETRVPSRLREGRKTTAYF